MHVTLITVKKVDAIYNLSSWGFCLSIQTNIVQIYIRVKNSSIIILINIAMKFD